MKKDFLNIQTGELINKQEIPLFDFETFKESVLDLAKNGYVVHYFIESNESMRLFAVLRKHALFVLSTVVEDNYDSLTASNSKFHMFEREISEQFDIHIDNHPWLKPVRKFKDDNLNSLYDFYDVEGEEIHQVAVGPVHAGIIEPGHFRFNCAGEKVLNLEIQLGYQHRGIEYELLDADINKIPFIINSVAGDSTIANSICYAQAMEGLSEFKASKNENLKRHIMLEIERLANHVGDLGALSGDVAFLAPASYFGRLRGEFLNLLLTVSGNRFGRYLIKPFKSIEFDEEKQNLFLNKLDELEPQIISIAELLLNNPGVLGRFESTGIVTNIEAKQLGLVGVAGRASGVRYDVRDHYCTINNFYDKYEVPVLGSGDVFARAKIRFIEIKNSFRIIRDFISYLDNEPVENVENFSLKPNSLILTMTEGWRGELSHCVITDSNGKILRYKLKDPSFHNWSGLSMAVRNEEISDFPLCNKSFNLSYCGFDI